MINFFDSFRNLTDLTLSVNKIETNMLALLLCELNLVKLEMAIDSEFHKKGEMKIRAIS